MTTQPPPTTTPRATHIRGARMHNLKGIDCRIPLGKLSVVTGVSGSGKSTLAFDVLYAEGQRRFAECLSAYARQFLERLERPDADEIGYVQPPIALKQQGAVRNARSTVGSITELSDLIRLLYVHAGEVHCPECGGRAERTEIAEALRAVNDYPEGTRLAVVAPFSHRVVRQDLVLLQRQGYVRVLTKQGVRDIEGLRSVRSVRGLVVDRVIAGRTRRQRMREALTSAWRIGAGTAILHPLPGSATTTAGSEEGSAEGGRATRSPLPEGVLRKGLACLACGRRLARPSVGLFSWNSPLGACPACQGFGRIITLDRHKVVPNPRRNLRNDAVAPFSVPTARAWYRRLLKAAAERDVPTDLPFEDLTPAQQDWVLRGDESFPGVEGFFERLEQKRYKMHVRIFIARFRGYVSCPQCGGRRLKPEALAVKVEGLDIGQLHDLPVSEVQAFFASLPATLTRAKATRRLLESVRRRLAYLSDVGVEYLTLGRAARTLSGGETQRIRLAAALGNSLTETLYILDEPTVGLHASDSARMLSVVKQLTAMGNTVVVVEHDPGIIAGADHLIVLGPGGGSEGGEKVYEGKPGPFLEENPGFFIAEVASPASTAVTYEKLREQRRRRRRMPGLPKTARAGKLDNPWNAAAVSAWLAQHAARKPSGPARAGASRTASGAGKGGATTSASTPPGTTVPRPSFPPGPRLTLRGVRAQNLRIPLLAIPLGRMVTISGISGSGKSTLLETVLYRNWLRHRGEPVEGVGEVSSIAGLDEFTDVHMVGQGFLGRSSRSNPLSFVQAYPEIRKLFAGTLRARQLGLTPGAFSFNTPGGRCESCRGTGSQTLEMYFMPDVEVTCEACEGRRFRPQVLEVTWQGKSVYDVLSMTVDVATRFFRKERAIVDRLAPLREVGLGYITLGQSTNTLSGGEAQRLRMAAFLSKHHRDERHLFLFDEPTTGLHARDVERLLRALRSLIAAGHSVLVVEHHLDLLRASDWVIDLGPGAGDAGGRVVYQGPVEGMLREPASMTAACLADHMERVLSAKA